MLATINVADTVAGILKALAPMAIPALLTGLTALGTLLGRWLHAHTNNSKVLGALATGADYIGSAVQHVLDGLQPDIQKALADDGKLSPEELSALKTKAVALILEEMPSALKVVANALGPAFQTWLSGKVGQAIQAQAPSTPQ